jgi:hypothetical protein
VDHRGRRDTCESADLVKGRAPGGRSVAWQPKQQHPSLRPTKARSSRKKQSRLPPGIHSHAVSVPIADARPLETNLTDESSRSVSRSLDYRAEKGRDDRTTQHAMQASTAGVDRRDRRGTAESRSFVKDRGPGGRSVAR